MTSKDKTAFLGKRLMNGQNRQIHKMDKITNKMNPTDWTVVTNLDRVDIIRQIRKNQLNF